MNKQDLKDVLFPYSKIRNIQDEMVHEVDNAIRNKKNIIIHAPTGLGKTAAAISPVLAFALKNKLTVFFLTGRQTQHKIAIDTLNEIKKAHGISITTIDLISKKSMCPVLGIDALYSNEFNEYCKLQREEGKCEYFSNTRKKSGKSTVEADYMAGKLKEKCPYHVEDAVKICAEAKLCPYEISSILAKDAVVIIADYNYIFNKSIRDAFFSKSSKKLEESIIIVDEGHNLGRRVREQLTQKLSSIALDRAEGEARKFGFSECAENLIRINKILLQMARRLDKGADERLVKKGEFVDKIEEMMDYDAAAAQLCLAGKGIMDIQKQSYLGSVGKFLEAWLGGDIGFARILSVMPSKKPAIVLSYRCLDPSLITKDIIEQAHSTILMSGTLTPTFMYRDLLGFGKDTIEKNFKSPFPKENRLNLVIPETTTKFTERDDKQYKKIAIKVNDILSDMPGRSAVFFPSYSLRDSIFFYLRDICEKQIFMEKQGLTKEEKEALLMKFQAKKDAILLGVATGNFGEGIDMPGVLKSVVIVGIPLERPNLETKELIDYYNGRFGKGWEYGYIMPAITRCMQNAGRCIRNEEDKGIIIFLDERFAWNNYYKCFPTDWNVCITKNYRHIINEFFDL